MKTLKSLFMLCAGLSFCACSSDNEPQLPEGNGMVEIKIVNPSTRATPTSGESVNIEGTLTVTLTDANGDKTQTVTIGSNDATSSKTVKFWNVINPSKVTASINDGIADYESVLITQESGTGGNLQAEPKYIPAYGETTGFTLSGTDTPTGSEDANSGYKTGDTEKTFSKYVASITMAIPVARLEVGHLTHEAHEQGDACRFSSLQIAGVYLDKLSNKGTVYTSKTVEQVTSYYYALADGANTVDYSMPAVDLEGEEDDIPAPILKAEISPATDFTSTSYYPAQNEVYAFNFYAGTNPQFKAYFSKAIFASGAEQGVDRAGWAMITNFKDTNGNPIVFENGKIYKVTGVTNLPPITDENIVADEENDAQYSVEVTVEEAVWSVVAVKGTWDE